MKRGRLLLGLAAAAVAVVLAIAFLSNKPLELPPVRPPPATGIVFAALGDAPYAKREEQAYPRALADIDAHELAVVLHVGDILGSPCTDQMYAQRLAWFQGLRHPLVYTPGDNEWTDCWGPGSGRFAPRERLARIRRVFFATPGHSLGQRRLPLVSQGDDPAYREFVENQRWSHAGVIFVTAHIVGSRNASVRFPGRTAADDAEVVRRTTAAAAWVRVAFAEAMAQKAPAVVVGFHGNAYLEKRAGHALRGDFEPFLQALEEEAERFAGPVLLVHGDFHDYIVDQPLVRRTTKRRLDNVTRLQVPGEPRVGWVRVVFTPGAAAPFSFESRLVF